MPQGIEDSTVTADGKHLQTNKQTNKHTNTLMDMLSTVKSVLADISSISSDKGLTLKTGNTLFTAYSISTLTLH